MIIVWIDSIVLNLSHVVLGLGQKDLCSFCAYFMLLYYPLSADFNESQAL